MSNPVKPEVGKLYIGEGGNTDNVEEVHRLVTLILRVEAISPKDQLDRNVRGKVRSVDEPHGEWKPYATSFAIFAHHWRPLLERPGVRQ